MNDDYIRNHSGSHKELMQQANDAVAEYASSLPARGMGMRGRLWHLAAAILFAVALVGLYFLFRA